MSFIKVNGNHRGESGEFDTCDVCGEIGYLTHTFGHLMCEDCLREFSNSLDENEAVLFDTRIYERGN